MRKREYTLLISDPLNLEDKERIISKKLADEQEGQIHFDQHVSKTANWAMSLDEYKKRMSWLSSHSAIEGMLIKFLISNEWQELSSKPYKLLHLPDRVFIKSNVKLLVEVKPGTARWNEIKKGLGQVLSLLATKNGIPVLVCSASWHDNLMRVLEPLNESIWLLLFTDDKRFIPVIGNFLE